jgi:hypothetical protein
VKLSMITGDALAKAARPRNAVAKLKVRFNKVGFLRFAQYQTYQDLILIAPLTAVNLKADKG